VILLAGLLGTMNSGSSSHLRVDSIYQRINSVISFVAENPVRAIASHTQVWLSRWYKDNSLVYVSHKHGVWNNIEGRRRPSKRYGRLLRSPKAGLNEMLVYHQGDVFNWITSRVTPAEGVSESGEEKDRGATKPVESQTRPI
jgi:histone deacetylase 6